VQLRSSFLASTLLALLLSAGAAPADGSAAGPGGTAGVPVSGAGSGGSAPAPARGGRASLHVTSIRITKVSCTPSSHCSANPRQVSLHGTLLMGGIGLKAGMVVGFPRSPGARISSFSPAARNRQWGYLLGTVPASAHSGRIKVLLSGGRYTSSYGPIYVFSHALHPPAPKRPPAPAPTGTPAGGPSSYDGQGMWIWYVSKSSGGSVPAIAAQAHAAGLSTVYVKSSDGSSNYWSQFSPQLVAELHANGLKVCAWQYVYGSGPAGEAALGAQAVANGADCLVIDAESEYEGRYAAAQRYLTELRAKIGPEYPWRWPPSLRQLPPQVPTGLPGPGAPVQPAADVLEGHRPVSKVYANTYIGNRIYGRPIFPLGQTYGGVSSTELVRFREEAVDYGATGISFWDWQETKTSGWAALAAPLEPLSSVTPNTSYPELRAGSKGDQVLWMQEHLASALPQQETTGVFAGQTLEDVGSFQASHGISPSGVVEAATWTALLALPPVAVSWTGSGPKERPQPRGRAARA
jgi:peptidoglycan hydrolase-like protein with peptidoglycan-binding domain